MTIQIWITQPLDRLVTQVWKVIFFLMDISLHQCKRIIDNKQNNAEMQ